MDWLQRLEQRKFIRKLARRILFKDFKVLVLSWRIIFLILVVTGYILPYFASLDNINLGLFVYISMGFLTTLGIQSEPVFVFLPMTQKEIRQYLTFRMELLLGGMVVFAAAFAAAMKLIGVPLFLERGLMSTLSMLYVTELVFVIYLCDRHEKAQKGRKLSGRAKARRIRDICYLVFGTAAWCYQIIAAMFMEQTGEKINQVLLLIAAVCFAVTGLCYVDVIHRTEFVKFQKERKGMGIFGRSSSASEKEGIAS